MKSTMKMLLNQAKSKMSTIISDMPFSRKKIDHSVIQYKKDKKDILNEENLFIDTDLLKRADNGSASAQLELGKAYFRAVFTQENAIKAFEWIHLSAKQGNLEALFQLAEFYAIGNGTQKSHTEAYNWYTKAAIQGYKKALIRIRNLYENDKMVHCRGQINLAEAKWDDEEFKEKNNIRELNEYRLIQLEPVLNGAIEYYSTEFKRYFLLLETGNIDDEGLKNLAFLYQHGYGVKKYTKRSIDLYVQAAKKGLVDAQYNAAYLFEKTSSIKFHYQKAFYWYTKAANGGNIAAQNSLANFYEKGLATDTDYETSISWYTKAAIAGNSSAQLNLGRIYRKGDYVKQNIGEAVKWYALAAQQGSPAAQNCLDKLHHNGMITSDSVKNKVSKETSKKPMSERLFTKLHNDVQKLDTSLSINHIKKIASHALVGDGTAMYQIGLKYYHGIDFAQDKDTGFRWMRKAARAGIQEAQLAVAEILKQDGDVVDQNYYKASIWYKRCTRQKNDAAQFSLGVLYDTGLGVRHDPLEASKWFTLSSEQRNADALCSLGVLRYEGRGLRKNLKEAIEWFKAAIRYKNIRAMAKLGALYLNEAELVNQIPMGLSLYRYAAKYGDANAQFELAQIYQAGEHTTKDLVKAKAYYSMMDPKGAELQYTMAVMYLNGNIVDKDDLKAFHLFRKSSENGYAKAKDRFNDRWFKFDSNDDYHNFVNMLICVSEKGIAPMECQIGSLYRYGREIAKGLIARPQLALAVEWYSIAAKKGDARAQLELGTIYQEECYSDKDTEIALDYYKQAYENNNRDSMAVLAVIYLQGHYVDQDFIKAFNLFTQAVNMGHTSAGEVLKLVQSVQEINIHIHDDTFYSKISIDMVIQMLEAVGNSQNVAVQYQLGLIHLKFTYDGEKAIKWFTLASNGGITDASYYLGKIHEEGKAGIHKDYSKAIRFYRKAVEKDHEKALFRLGRLYHFGKGIKVHYATAYSLYTRAAQLEHKMAQEFLNITDTYNADNIHPGDLLFIDELSGSFRHSIRMCEHVAKKGDHELQYKLGYVYENTVGEPDYKKAIKWYSRASNTSHREATYRLGLLQERGLGTKQNYRKSFNSFRQAYRRGSNDALYKMAEAYHRGTGIDQDASKALAFYQEAASHGQPEAQHELGKLYERGELVQKDILEALKWYTKAYLQGFEAVESDLYAMYDDLESSTHSDSRLFRIYSSVSRSLYFEDDEKYHENYGSILYQLGLWHFHGKVVPKDYGKALENFSEACCRFHCQEAIHFIDLDFDDTDKALYLKKCEMYAETADLLPHNMLCVYLESFYLENRFKIAHDYKNLHNYSKYLDGNQLGTIMKRLAYKYGSGDGIEKNIDQAVYWYQAASSQEYGFCHANAIHIAKLYATDSDFYDISKAIKYYTIAAENGFNQACLTLAQIYHYHDVAQNFSKALEYYEKTTSYIHYAKLGIGLLYEYGDGIDQDYDAAIDCYKESYDGGNPFASYHLGLMYFNGKGVVQNYRKAFELFTGTKSRIWKTMEKQQVVQVLETMCDDEKTERVYSYVNQNFIIGEANNYLRRMLYSGLGTPVPRYVETKGLGKRGNSSLF